MSSDDQSTKLLLCYNDLVKECEDDKISFNLEKLESTQELYNNFRQIIYDENSLSLEKIDICCTKLLIRYIEGNSMSLSHLSTYLLKMLYPEYYQPIDLCLDDNGDEDMNINDVSSSNNRKTNEYLYSHLTEELLCEFVKSLANREGSGIEFSKDKDSYSDENPRYGWHWTCTNKTLLPSEEKNYILSIRQLRKARQDTTKKLYTYLKDIKEQRNQEKLKKDEETYIKANQKKILAYQNSLTALNKLQEDYKKKEEKKQKMFSMQQKKEEKKQKVLSLQQKKEEKQKESILKKEEEEIEEAKKKEQIKETKHMKSLFNFFSSSDKSIQSSSPVSSVPSIVHSNLITTLNKTNMTNTTSDQNCISQTIQNPSLSDKSDNNCAEEMKESIDKENQYKQECNDSQDIPKLKLDKMKIFKTLKTHSSNQYKQLHHLYHQEYTKYLQKKDEENKTNSEDIKPLDATVINPISPMASSIKIDSHSDSDVEMIPTTKTPQMSPIKHTKPILSLKYKHFQYSDQTIYFHLYPWYSYQLRQFYEDNRPAFFGSCIKKSLLVNGRHPFSQEKDYNYETDSGVEWYGDIDNEDINDDEDDLEEDDDETTNEPITNQFDYNDNFLVEDDVEGDGTANLTSEEKAKYILNQISGRHKGEDFSGKTKKPLLINVMNPDNITILSTTTSRDLSLDDNASNSSVCITNPTEDSPKVENSISIQSNKKIDSQVNEHVSDDLDMNNEVIPLSSDCQETSVSIQQDITTPELSDIPPLESPENQYTYHYISNSSCMDCVPSMFMQQAITCAEDLNLCTIHVLLNMEDIQTIKLRQHAVNSKTKDIPVSNENLEQNALNIPSKPKIIMSPSKQRIDLDENMIKYIVLISHNQSISIPNVVDTVFAKYSMLRKIQIERKFREIMDHKEKSKITKKSIWKIKSSILHQFNIPDDYIYDSSSSFIPIFNEQGSIINEDQQVKEQENTKEMVSAVSDVSEKKEDNKDMPDIKRIQDAILCTTSFANGFVISTDSNSGYESLNNTTTTANNNTTTNTNNNTTTNTTINTTTNNNNTTNNTTTNTNTTTNNNNAISAITPLTSSSTFKSTSLPESFSHSSLFSNSENKNISLSINNSSTSDPTLLVTSSQGTSLSSNTNTNSGSNTSSSPRIKQKKHISPVPVSQTELIELSSQSSSHEFSHSYTQKLQFDSFGTALNTYNSLKHSVSSNSSINENNNDNNEYIKPNTIIHSSLFSNNQNTLNQSESKADLSTQITQNNSVSDIPISSSTISKESSSINIEPIQINDIILDQDMSTSITTKENPLKQNHNDIHENDIIILDDDNSKDLNLSITSQTNKRISTSDIDMSPKKTKVSGSNSIMSYFSPK